MTEPSKTASRRSRARRLASDAAGGTAPQRWMQASEVISMFPSLVWKIQLEAGVRDALNARIVAALAGLRRELPALQASQGWQSAHALHRRGDFGELVACVGRGVTSVLRFLRIGVEAFEITGC